MRRSTVSLVAATLAAALFTPSPLPASQDWELLGTRRVSFGAETDVIEVTRREGQFEAIRIEVDDGTIEMYDVRVVFANGEDFSPSTRLEFREGQTSRVIDLPGNDRIIQRIAFKYKSRVRRGHATVRVYGRRAGGTDQAMDGWKHIGAREVDFRTDRDVIRVEGEAAFRSILLKTDGADVEMFNIRVSFANGESFSPDTRILFRENSRSRVIDLPGAVRSIRTIEFNYRTARRGEGKAVIHVYGRT